MTTTSTQKKDATSFADQADNAAEGKSRKSATAFRTISEVADELEVQQHVLRFWETKFSQVKPLKRGGGRRYYRPEDVLLLKKIHELLYTEGYTIKGVQKLLREQGRAQLLSGQPLPARQPAEESSAAAAPAPAVVAENAPAERPGLSNRQKVILQSMLGELRELRDLIKNN